MVRVEQWPHELDKMDGDRMTFKPVTATIAKVFAGGNGKNPGWKFVEDTTPDGQYKGVIWNHAGTWNKDKNSRDPYTGQTGREGLKVLVSLRTNAGRDRTFYDVLSIRPAGEGEAEPQQAPREAYREPEPQPSTFMPTDVRIAKAQAFNALTSMLAGMTKRLEDALDSAGYKYEDLIVAWAEGYEDLKAGKTPFVVEEPVIDDTPSIEDGARMADEDDGFIVDADQYSGPPEEATPW